MADKGLDFSGWKKIKEGPDSTEFQHADGHTMQVSHKALSPQLKKQLKGLPASMADAGIVGESVDKPAANYDSDNSAPVAPSQGNMGIMSARPGQDPTENLEEHASPELKDPVMASQVAESKAAEEGLAGQKAANTRVAEESGKIAEQQAPAINQASLEQQKTEQNLQQEMEFHKNKAQEVINDGVEALKKGELLPTHLFQNQNLPQRIGTAIGLLLGGMGGGMLHQENPVLKQMNQEIQNDFQKQQMNMNNRVNFLGAISNQLGHSAGAAQIATAIADEYSKNKIIAIADSMGTDRAKQIAAGLNAQLTSGQTQVPGTAAFLATMRRRMGAGSTAKVDPDEALIQNYWRKGQQTAVDNAVSKVGTVHGISPGVLSYASDATKKSFVPGPDGKMYGTSSPENAAKYNEEAIKYEPLIKDLGEIQKLGGLSSKLSIGPKAAEANAAAARIQQQLLSLGTSGRLSDTALGFSKEMFSDPTKIRSFLSRNADTNKLMQSLSSHMQTTRQQYVPSMRSIKVTEKKRQ